MIAANKGILTINEDCNKVIISKVKNSYNCDIHGKTELPLPFGDGVYTVKTLKHLSGKRYQVLKTKQIKASGTDEYKLLPNPYVPKTPAWEFAATLCNGKTGIDAYNTICKWVKDNIIYDYIRAVTVKKNGVLPDPLYCWENKRGICQDIASLAAGMLRAVGIKTTLVIGHADKRYHAWVECEIKGKTYRFDATGKAKEYKGERWY